MKNVVIKAFATICTLAISACTSDNQGYPSLIGSDSQENIYANSSNVVNGSYTGTFVGQRVAAFRQELKQLTQAQKSNQKELDKISSNVSRNANLYQKTISTVQNKLQAGTTPGNPNMYAMLQQAQGNVQNMFTNANALENLSTKTATTLTSINYLENSISAAFNISGAVDEDHKQLRELQSETIALAQKASALNDSVSSAANFQQQNAVQSSQEVNALHDSVKIGSSSGNFSRTISHSPAVTPLVATSHTSAPRSTNAGFNNMPLFSVKFNNSNVNYRDGLNTAVKSALSRKPNAIFDVVAVSSSANQDRAQSYASKIMNEVVSFGANANNVNLNARISERSPVSEVLLFVR